MDEGEASTLRLNERMKWIFDYQKLTCNYYLFRERNGMIILCRDLVVIHFAAARFTSNSPSHRRILQVQVRVIPSGAHQS